MRVGPRTLPVARLGFGQNGVVVSVETVQVVVSSPAWATVVQLVGPAVAVAIALFGVWRERGARERQRREQRKLERSRALSRAQRIRWRCTGMSSTGHPGPRQNISVKIHNYNDHPIFDMTVAGVHVPQAEPPGIWRGNSPTSRWLDSRENREFHGLWKEIVGNGGEVDAILTRGSVPEAVPLLTWRDESGFWFKINETGIAEFDTEKSQPIVVK